MVALTDHDTVAGVLEAARVAGRYDVELIAGLELEIDYQAPGAFHLLGLGLNCVSGQLAALLNRIAAMRHERNDRILRRMHDAGIEVERREVAAFAGGDVLARPHFARFLVQRRLVRTVQEAFDRYLGDGKPFWQPKGAVSLEEAAAAIHSAGGKALIAHPMTLYISINAMAERLRDWQAAGIDGIEAYHPGARLTDCRKLEAIADSAGLMVSAGSDYHGPERADRGLGHSADGIAIDSRYADGFARFPVGKDEDCRVDAG